MALSMPEQETLVLRMKPPFRHDPDTLDLTSLHELDPRLMGREHLSIASGSDHVTFLKAAKAVKMLQS